MQCILGALNPITMAVRAFSLVLLLTFVTIIFGLPTSPGKRIDHSLYIRYLIMRCVIIFYESFFVYNVFYFFGKSCM